ncbi:MAG: EVE domain-containing protein [Pseudomonadota bacterium]
MAYWLFKSEPETFSIDHLKACPKNTDAWNGVRNYQARNMLRDQIKIGDEGFFYHSNCKTPGIVGTVKVVRASYPDTTQFDPESEYYDPKSSEDNPRWFVVDVKFNQKFSSIISLQQLKMIPELADMIVLRTGNRLSITPVTTKEWNIILNFK